MKTQKVLVINSGSSSIKYKLFAADGLRELAFGLIEEIGTPRSRIEQSHGGDSGSEEGISEKVRVADHGEGLELVLRTLKESALASGTDDIVCVGHRVVHGGEAFTEPVVIDAGVLEAIENNSPLAPLHNPANLSGIKMSLKLFAKSTQVAVFDTAFHQSLPPMAFHYALPPYMYSEHHVRRYGFHGISHQYASQKTASYLSCETQSLDVITVHLGSGASMAAVKDGRCMDTSMGMTPLEGLMMGTRSGDLDPALPLYMENTLDITGEEVAEILYNKSGLKGVAGTSDMRTVIERYLDGDKRARLALDMYSYRVRKYIGAYFAALGRLDALVFTGAIGENSALVRTLCCQGLERLGIEIDEDKNRACDHCDALCEIGSGEVRVLVVAADEELEIATQSIELVGTHGLG